MNIDKIQKINIFTNNKSIRDFHGFTLQEGFIFGFINNTHSFVCNGTIFSNYINVYFSDICGNWQSRRIFKSNPLYEKITKTIQKNNLKVKQAQDKFIMNEYAIKENENNLKTTKSKDEQNKLNQEKNKLIAEKKKIENKLQIEKKYANSLQLEEIRINALRKEGITPTLFSKNDGVNRKSKCRNNITNYATEMNYLQTSRPVIHRA